VPLATVRDILDRAARAPSGGNLQPWRVHALAGAPLEDLKARSARMRRRTRAGGGRYQVYPEPLKSHIMPGAARSREALHAIGIAREDRAGRYRQ